MLLAGVEFLASAVVGLFIYIALDPRMSADTLASFLFAFGAPAVLLGAPALLGGSYLLLAKRWVPAALAMIFLPALFGSFAFAGFWVGAMGI